MEILFLVAALFLVGLLLHRFSKGTLKVLGSISLILVILMSIFGFFVISDANDFKNNFSKNKNIFVLENNGEIISAVIINFQNKNIDTYDDLETLKENLALKKAPQGFYKVFFINKEALIQSQGDLIDLGFTQMGKDSVINSLFSKESKKFLTEDQSESIRIQISTAFETDQQLRDYLYTMTMVNLFGNNPINLINGVKNGNIIIYPETLMFKTIKYIPDSIFDTADSFAR